MPLSGPCDAVLPAGGRLYGAFAERTGVTAKALLSFEGRSILKRTISALRAEPRIGRIVVIGPQEVREEAMAAGADAAIEERSSAPENLQRGLDWLVRPAAGLPARRVLIVAADLPFLTAEAIGRFLDACPAGCDLAAPLVRREEFDAAYPATPSTFVRLRDGEVTLGCVFLVDPETIARCRAAIDRAFEARKSQWQMARLLGAGVVLRWVAGRLSTQHLVNRLDQTLGCRSCAVGGAPELAYDVDLPEDYDYALKYLSGQSPPREPVSGC